MNILRLSILKNLRGFHWPRLCFISGVEINSGDKMTKRMIKQPHIRDINVIDLILIDHRFIKECVETLANDLADKNLKLSMAKGFLETLTLHSIAEKNIVYAPLVDEEEFHFNILESQIEHGIVDEKVKLLKPKVAHAKILKDELSAELKVLAELVKHHIKEEESELLPKMSEQLDQETLKLMGEEFMKARKMNSNDLKDYPHLQDELISWKDDVQKVSSQFLSKMDNYVENLKH
jgi:hemerythrin-like domain-containing protein